ncbi:DNA-directed RNA polymerase sigma-70 factor (plasmid) [Fulvitalea axinellae]|uniref:DNA-directed RNA polymerase sigma-70 factor n=1 Tax=Fulvitalea axinellae TaxID=1182444 RepID=A0AAU9CY34_9BACT|nr:DNA-directed RNA polymerase sigma-70 factor [Fulvitalea axinellae]
MIEAKNDFLRLLKAKEYEEAFRVLYSAYFQRMFNYACGILNNPNKAEDITQEVLIDLWEKREQLRITVQLDTFLYKGIYFRAMNEIRKEKLHQERESEVEEEFYGSQDHTEWKEQLHRQIRQCADNFPEQCREVFYLSRYSHLSRSEIAEQMGISVRTVDTQLYRALKSLKNRLRKKVSR